MAELRKTLLGWADFCSCKTCISDIHGGQSVLWHCQGAESSAIAPWIALPRPSMDSSARYRQMDTTQVTLLSLEAMGKSRLSGIAQTRSDSARSLEHQQIGAWPMAVIKDPGAHAGSASKVLYQCGATRPGGEVGICSLNRRGT